MLTSYSDTLSSQMTPPREWKLTESLLAVFESLSLRYSFNVGTAGQSRAPPRPPPGPTDDARNNVRTVSQREGIMFISEFYSKLISSHEGSRLFDALRRVSRLETRALQATGAAGWAEWPPIDDGPESCGLQLKKA